MELEWLNEEDYYEFHYKGYECLIKRNPQMGHLCGYIKPLNSKIDVELFRDILDETFYGGLTYLEGNRAGFDCAHGMDLIPSLSVNKIYSKSDFFERTYKNVQFVETELKRAIDIITPKINIVWDSNI